MNVTTKIEPWIKRAEMLTGAAGTVVWESGLMPDPKTGNVAVVVVFWARGATLDSVMQGSLLIQNPANIAEKAFIAEVVDFLTQFMDARAQAQRAEPAQGAPTASGLILPG